MTFLRALLLGTLFAAAAAAGHAATTLRQSEQPLIMPEFPKGVIPA